MSDLIQEKRKRCGEPLNATGLSPPMTSQHVVLRRNWMCRSLDRYPFSFGYDTSVRRHGRSRRIDVFAKLGIDVFAKLGIDAVDALGYRFLAGDEDDPPEVLTPDAPVFVGFAGTPPFAVVDEVLGTGL